MATVSVIIPAFNAELFIEKCLVSINQQTFKDFEVIVVDDCSSDRTYEIASLHAQVIRNEKNLGEGVTRNAGARHSQGEILAFTDADVVAPSKWLENIVTIMGRLKIHCVGGGYCGSVGNSFIERFAYHELEFRRAKFTGFVKTLVGNNFACTREVFFQCGGFPEDGNRCGDLILSYKISKRWQIFWDKENGVYHQFRKDLAGYLRQQFFFSRDTLFTYYQFPELFIAKTHQGKSIYFEVLMALFSFSCLFAGLFNHSFYLLFVFFLVLMALFNLRFLRFLQTKNLGIMKNLGIILLRNFVCSFGILAGLLICAKDILEKRKALALR